MEQTDTDVDAFLAGLDGEHADTMRTIDAIIADVLSGTVHVYVDGVGTALRSTSRREDVATAFPAYESYQHGWSARLTASPGRHQVCSYGIDSGPGGTLVMGCTTVTVPAS